MPLDKLPPKILFLLGDKGKMRYCEIVNALWENPENQKLVNNDFASFRIMIFQRLKKLTWDGYLEREEKGRRNVSYSLTARGKKKIQRLILINELRWQPSEEIQALQSFMLFNIRYVSIMAPGASLEDYLVMLREKLSRSDALNLAKGILNDPLKRYRFYTETLNKAYTKRRIHLENKLERS